MAKQQDAWMARRAFETPRIAMPWSGTPSLWLGVRILGLAFAYAVFSPAEEPARPPCAVPSRNISVDGLTNDWEGIPPHVVQGEQHLWFGQGMTRDKWRDDNDLSGVLTLGEAAPAAAQASGKKLLGRLTDNVEVSAMAGPDGRWGLVVTSAGLASASQPNPIQLEVLDPAGQITARQAGYDRLEFNDDGCTCWGEIALGAATIQVTDRWTCQDHVLAVDRNLMVRGTDEGAFLSAVTWTLTERQAWPDVTWFVPGMIYNGWDNLTEVAIGGKAFYQPGQYAMRIREDRLPAPLISARCQDGNSLAVLNPRPVGTTTLADAADVTADKPLVDRRFAFGALGANEDASGLTLGYWYPGTEGEVTYRGDTYPGGQLHAWRHRYHPLADGLSQQYRVEFRFGRDESLDRWRRDNWRWAWQRLAPQVTPQDIEAVRHSLADMLVAQIQTASDRKGLPNFINTQDLSQVDRKAILGFCGANLDAAVALLYEANRDPTPRGERLRDAASAIIDSFLKLNMAPPQGEGFLIDSGQPVTALCHTGDKQMFLRSFGDDLKRLLIAYEREKRAGREHPSWLAWCRQFADWLLTQQQPDGSFPRSWHQDTGRIHNGAGQGSYNAIPLLVALHRITSDARYLESARRAGEYCWSHGQNCGVFVGGTIDNPNVIDKEAGTLSLEAYLALSESTGEEAWLQRAKAAGDFAESWIYLWNVPMPSEDNPNTLHWKPDVPTTGVQLIATGHSLVDCFMTYNAAHYAKLANLTGDAHYREVARILLHNTKNMLAIPGRTFDLPGPGWQQEHWSFAPRRGQGLHRGWLPWVSTSHLNGLQALEELDAGLLE